MRNLFGHWSSPWSNPEVEILYNSAHARFIFVDTLQINDLEDYFAIRISCGYESGVGF